MALTKCTTRGEVIATDAKACPHCGKPPARPGLGTGTMLAIVLGGLALFCCVGGPGASTVEKRSDAEVAPAVEVPAAAAVTVEAPDAGLDPKEAAEKDRRFEECRGKVKLAASLGVLHDFGWKSPQPPRVVAGPTFFDIPIDAKEGVAESINCFLMGGGSGYIDFDLLHWSTGEAAYRFSRGKLRKL